jgi:hypothetical protein
VDIPQSVALKFPKSDILFISKWNAGFESMLINTKDLNKYPIKSSDGYPGTISDYYFDDLFWNIQYLIIETEQLLRDQTVLLSHIALGDLDTENQQLSVRLSLEDLEKVKHRDQNVLESEAGDKKIVEILKWPRSRLNIKLLKQTELESLMINMMPHKSHSTQQNDPHLRSRNEFLGYTILAKNKEIGYVDDFIIETDNWSIRFLIIDTHNWLSDGDNVLISPAWIEKIKWKDHLIHIDLKKEIIKDSPPYDRSKPPDEDYESKLFKYYDSRRFKNED